MRKCFIFAVFSIFFLACEEEAIPVPLPPTPSTQTVDESDPLASQEQESDKAAASEHVSKPEPAHKAAEKLHIPIESGDAEQLNYGKYTIQVAVLPSETAAKNLAKKISDNGISSYYAKVYNPSTLYGLYHRVRVGYFSGKSSAERFARNNLEPLGYAWWVDLAKNDTIGNPYADPETKEAAKAAAKEAAKAAAQAAAKAASDKETAKQAAKQAAREAAIESGKAAREAAKLEVPPPKIPGK